MTELPINNPLGPQLRARQVQNQAIGSGRQGAVFRVSGSRVVKLTRESKEAAVALWQVSNANPALPMIHEVLAAADDNDPNALLFAVVREDATDVHAANPLAFNHAIKFLDSPHLGQNVNPADRLLFEEARKLLKDQLNILSVGDASVDNFGRGQDERLVLRDLGSISPMEWQRGGRQITSDWRPPSPGLCRLYPNG